MVSSTVVCSTLRLFPLLLLSLSSQGLWVRVLCSHWVQRKLFSQSRKNKIKVHFLGELPFVEVPIWSNLDFKHVTSFDCNDLEFPIRRSQDWSGSTQGESGVSVMSRGRPVIHYTHIWSAGSELKVFFFYLQEKTPRTSSCSNTLTQFPLVQTRVNPLTHASATGHTDWFTTCLSSSTNMLLIINNSACRPMKQEVFHTVMIE